MFIGFSEGDRGVFHNGLRTQAAWNLYERAKYESRQSGCQTGLSCVAKRAPWTGTAWGAWGRLSVSDGCTVLHVRYDSMLLFLPLSMGGPHLIFIPPPISTIGRWCMQLSTSTSSAPSATSELWVSWQGFSWCACYFGPKVNCSGAKGRRGGGLFKEKKSGEKTGLHTTGLKKPSPVKNFLPSCLVGWI